MKFKNFLIITIFLLFTAVFAWASKPEWAEKKVNWKLSGGQKIQKIKYPKEKSPLASDIKKSKSKETSATITKETATTPTNSFTAAYTIDSPPVDGFVPWVAITTTDKREPNDNLDFLAYTETSIAGSYTASSPSTDFVIGIFDTGASAHLIGYENAVTLDLYTGGYITDGEITLTGVTGEAIARVSYPLGIFIDGLQVIDSGTLSTFNMKGQSNTSIVVGQEPDPGKPDLPTAIGTPLAVYYTTVIQNDQQITKTVNSTEYTAPQINIYEPNDGPIPSYPKTVPLELKPLGGTNVQYTPKLDAWEILSNPFADLSEPANPSIIIGNLTQSVFFVHSVDLIEGSLSSIDKQRFMLDTGAQVSVISSRIAARLGLNTNSPEFEVDITGASGETTSEPGFYIDSVKIPALGGWLTYTNVPVVLLDIASPEGGTLDGIIGMNLFLNYNMVLKGGGLFLQDPPSLELEPILANFNLIGDIYPQPDGDGIVDFKDLSVISSAWLTSQGSGNYDNTADIAPQPNGDNTIDMQDLTLMFEHWLEKI